MCVSISISISISFSVTQTPYCKTEGALHSHYIMCYTDQVGRIGRFKLRLGLFKRFIRLREYPILKPILG